MKKKKHIYDVLVMYVVIFGLHAISTADSDQTNVRSGHGHTIFPWTQAARRRKCSFWVNCQNIEYKILIYKFNWKSVTNIARSKPTEVMDVYCYECCVLSGTYMCDNSITISDEIYNPCVCIGVLVCSCVCLCVCVCVSTHELVPLYHTEL